MFLAASADFCARFRTSSATTAKPLPAAPARAASIAAFSARILVWKAMSSMVLIILLISADFSLIWLIASFISCICPSLFNISSFPTLAFSLAFMALSAFCFTRTEISLMVEDSSSILLACSVEPCVRFCAPLSTFLADWETRSEERRIFPIRSVNFVVKSRRASFTLANSPA